MKETMSMTSADTPSFAGSSILRQSPPFQSSTHTGPGGADLSLSELYISDRSEDGTASIPFSLLPQRGEDDKKPEYDEREAIYPQDDHIDEADEGDGVVTDKGKKSLNAARTREERLQHDLFVLRKLNASFSLYSDALKDTRSTTENVALQLDRTDRLLDQYVNLLRHTENNSNLIFNETWEGGGTDQEILNRLRVEAVQKAQHEREEREVAARMEQERLEREEQEQKGKAARIAKERDKTGSGSVQGVRGVRGLRTRGAERGTSIATRGRIPSTSASATISKGGSSVVSSRGSMVSRGGRRS